MGPDVVEALGGWTVVHGLDLPPTSSGVPAARDFVRGTLSEAGLHGIADTAALLVSELATNAVLHARSDYRIEVLIAADSVRFTVFDSNPSTAFRRLNRIDAATGRGLALVEAMSTRWGATPRGQLGGHAKGIWFELPTDADELPDAGEGTLFGEDWLARAEDL